MHNSLVNRWNASPVTAREGGGTSATFRLRLMQIAFVFPLAIVAGRLIYLQSTISDKYVEQWSKATVDMVQLPPKPGRILSADGQVLAGNLPQ